LDHLDKAFVDKNFVFEDDSGPRKLPADKAVGAESTGTPCLAVFIGR
jgi:hypothetical protein